MDAKVTMTTDLVAVTSPRTKIYSLQYPCKQDLSNIWQEDDNPMMNCHRKFAWSTRQFGRFCIG